jgi:hypothetical protein
MWSLHVFAAWLDNALRRAPGAADEAGFSTAELLGNAALGIAALVAIWAGLTGMGNSVVDWISGQLLGG